MSDYFTITLIAVLVVVLLYLIAYTICMYFLQSNLIDTKLTTIEINVIKSKTKYQLENALYKLSLINSFRRKHYLKIQKIIRTISIKQQQLNN